MAMNAESQFHWCGYSARDGRVEAPASSHRGRRAPRSRVAQEDCRLPGSRSTSLEGPPNCRDPLGMCGRASRDIISTEVKETRRSGTERGPSLLVALDHLRRANLRIVRVLPELAPGLPLAQKVVALVKLEPDPASSRSCSAVPMPPGVTSLLPEVLFLVRQPIDPIEKRFVCHIHAPREWRLPEGRAGDDREVGFAQRGLRHRWVLSTRAWVGEHTARGPAGAHPA